LGPYTTASGRQSRRPGAGLPGDGFLLVNGTDTPYTASESGASGRATRNTAHRQLEMDLDAPDGKRTARSSGSEQDETDENYDAKDVSSDDDNDNGSVGSDSILEHESPRSLKLILKFKDPNLLKGVDLHSEAGDSVDSAHVTNGMSQATLHDRTEQINDQKDSAGDTSMIINGSGIE